MQEGINQPQVALDSVLQHQQTAWVLLQAHNKNNFLKSQYSILAFFWLNFKNELLKKGFDQTSVGQGKSGPHHEQCSQGSQASNGLSQPAPYFSSMTESSVALYFAGKWSLRIAGGTQHGPATSVEQQRFSFLGLGAITPVKFNG